MSTPQDAARENSRQDDGRFGTQAYDRATSVTLAPPRRSGVDAGDRVDRAVPDAQDDVYAPPPTLSPADERRVGLLNQVTGPGPHLDELSDVERSALMVHLARIDETISRHQGNTATTEDYPTDPEVMAETHDAYSYRGSYSPDDPSEIDYEMLSEAAADELRELRSDWLRYGEAVSSARPVF